jgi:phage terminase large subunit-like protein
MNHKPINVYRKGVTKMENTQRIISLVLKAVAVGMSVASIVLLFLPDAADIDTHVTLLSIGLFALAVAALQKE